MAASSTCCKPCTECSIRWPGMIQPTRAAVLPPSEYRAKTLSPRSTKVAGSENEPPMGQPL
eukprot:11222895-Heterocapsa_arctica.AAC.1